MQNIPIYEEISAGTEHVQSHGHEIQMATQQYEEIKPKSDCSYTTCEAYATTLAKQISTDPQNVSHVYEDVTLKDEEKSVYLFTECPAYANSQN